MMMPQLLCVPNVSLSKMSLTFIFMIYIPLIKYTGSNLTYQLVKEKRKMRRIRAYIKVIYRKAYTYKGRWEEPPCTIAVGY
jgi:hypothetical protein